MLIGSIIDVFLAGYRILTGRFYQNFSKIDQKVILHSINLVKIAKLDKEIIKILIISIHYTLLMVNFLHLARNKLKFQLFLQNRLCKKQFSYTFKKSFGEILPKVIKFCTIIGTIVLQWGVLLSKF